MTVLNIPRIVPFRFPYKQPLTVKFNEYENVACSLSFWPDFLQSEPRCSSNSVFD